METRRDFIKKAALASGAVGMASILPAAIQRALAIDPAKGSTFMDAEHVVILMQENRSFDHCYGTLRGVRGFNDPRAVKLPNRNPVFFQTNEAGETYAPFRLNIKDTNATWMGSLPHSWTNQVDARNDGKMDRWLQVKKSGHPPFAKMPLTLGYYNREDLPFYHSMADAFTICDQNFCSSLTGTTPNRLYLWTGTIREAANENVQARVLNEDADYETEVGWTTFPERLEDQGVSWKIYQNEVSVGVGLNPEEDAWLANFGDNPIEYFTQYNVRFTPGYLQNLPARIAWIKAEIEKRQKDLNGASAGDAEKIRRYLKRLERGHEQALLDEKKYTPENFSKLTEREKSIHRKAFVTNVKDQNYHKLEDFNYKADGQERTVKIPKGDVLFQFREDVKNGQLPTVSWLVAPENLSDHPSAPWYGAAYISEAIDILTHDPEVWKKTIFILCYDENDGYFDHVAPFTAPDPTKPETGRTSAGIDTKVDFVRLEQDSKWKDAHEARNSSIGLGFRVPLVIASPWSRGGMVNSQVFDHTSILQFLEVFLSNKTGRKITEPNISDWRRTVCGDLTSTFRPYDGEKIPLPEFLSSSAYYSEIHRAKFKSVPTGFQALNASEISSAKKNVMPALIARQEPGTRASNALPYELYAESFLSTAKSHVVISLKAADTIFKRKSAGSPFNVYLWNYHGKGSAKGSSALTAKAYAVKAGDSLEDEIALSDFTNGTYDIEIYGPNGFYRHCRGDKNDKLTVTLSYETNGEGASGNVIVRLKSNLSTSKKVEIVDRSYKNEPRLISLQGGREAIEVFATTQSSGWYDLSLQIKGDENYLRTYAGRVETGKETTSDPAMA